MRRLFIFVLLLVPVAASAQVLDIEVTGIAQPTPVAVVPFGWEGRDGAPPLNVSTVITADLRRSGRFEPSVDSDDRRDQFFDVPVQVDDTSAEVRGWVLHGLLDPIGSTELLEEVLNLSFPKELVASAEREIRERVSGGRKADRRLRDVEADDGRPGVRSRHRCGVMAASATWHEDTPRDFVALA